MRWQWLSFRRDLLLLEKECDSAKGVVIVSHLLQTLSFLIKKLLAIVFCLCKANVVSHPASQKFQSLSLAFWHLVHENKLTIAL